MESSKYKGVSLESHIHNRYGRVRTKRWVARIEHALTRKKKTFETEHEAAVQYDKWVIEMGLDRPLNILKRKVPCAQS